MTTSDPFVKIKSTSAEEAKLQMNVYALLLLGGKWKSSVLVARTGRGDNRVREAIRQLRLRGVVVCSDTRGFFLAQDAVEAEYTVKHLFSRARQILKVARAIDSGRRAAFGQSFSFPEQVEMAFGDEEESDDSESSDP